METKPFLLNDTFIRFIFTAIANYIIKLMIIAHECSVNYQRYSFTKFSQRSIFMITITTSFKERSILFVTDGYLVHSRILNKAFKEVPVSTIIHQFIILNLSISGEVFKS